MKKYVMFSTTVEVYSIQFVSPLRFTIHLETDLLSFYVALFPTHSTVFLLFFLRKQTNFHGYEFLYCYCENKIVFFCLKIFQGKEEKLCI